MNRAARPATERSWPTPTPRPGTQPNCADGGHEACSYLRSGFDRKGVPESENRLLALRHLAGVRAGWQVVEECIDSASAAQEGGENRPASLPTLEGRHAPPVRLVIADAPVSADEIFARPGPLATHGEAFAPLAVLLSAGSFPRSRAPVRGAAFAITKSCSCRREPGCRS
jgi:hypothetical protein